MAWLAGRRGADVQARLSSSQDGHRLVPRSAGRTTPGQTKRNIRRRIPDPEPNELLREGLTVSLRHPMNIKTLSTVAVVTAALIAPAYAQYHQLRGHGYGPAHGIRTFRGANNQLPANKAGREFTLGSAVCPGGARSFDCKVWPPPAYDDPDRRAGDGGP